MIKSEWIISGRSGISSKWMKLIASISYLDLVLLCWPCLLSLSGELRDLWNVPFTLRPVLSEPLNAPSIRSPVGKVRVPCRKGKKILQVLEQGWAQSEKKKT